MLFLVTLQNTKAVFSLQLLLSISEGISVHTWQPYVIFAAIVQGNNYPNCTRNLLNGDDASQISSNY